MKTKEEIRIEAEKVIAIGSKLPIEKIIKMIEKKEATKAKREKRSDKNWKKRELAKNLKSVKKWEGLTMAEINRMNSLENLPSSMR